MGLLDYVNYIQTLFNYYKIKYDKSALSAIVNRCNKDFGKINNEVNKLMLYAGSEIPIDRQVIESVVATDTETQVFEFIYAILYIIDVVDKSHSVAIHVDGKLIHSSLYCRTIDQNQYVAFDDIIDVIKPLFRLLHSEFFVEIFDYDKSAVAEHRRIRRFQNSMKNYVSGTFTFELNNDRIKVERFWRY